MWRKIEGTILVYLSSFYGSYLLECKMSIFEYSENSTYTIKDTKVNSITCHE